MAPGLRPAILLFLISSLVPIAKPSIIFNFTSFTPNTMGINYTGDAYTSGDHVIQLTRNKVDGSLRKSAGQAVYATPIQLWDPSTGGIADFTTHFKFNIKVLDMDNYGDGLAFFVAPSDYRLPLNSNGQWLGIFNSTTNNASSTRIVAVEFDTYKNAWDPDGNHIGIDINAIESKTTRTWSSNMKEENIGSAWIGYDSTEMAFYVYLSYDSETFDGETSLSYTINLTDVLPPEVIVGFSASTGLSTELHQIVSWDFVTSFDKDREVTRPSPSVGAPSVGAPSAAAPGGAPPSGAAPSVGVPSAAAPSGAPPSGAAPSGKKKHVQWIVGSVVIVGVLVGSIGYFPFVHRRLCKKKVDEEDVLYPSIEDDVMKGTGPRRFAYKQLVMATKNFSEDGKLGQGGFGGVYMGVLNNNPVEKVAVKRISRGSSQGRKEYISEVTVISRLRHRNLVRLIGWCREYGELLLVYEYMPNGSLDSYLFGKKAPLAWLTRYKIAQGLASALLYLHEEWEQCVVHRDIKSSNVMLDSSFNAKLGDFGLARLVDHDLGSQTTVLAGTMGYLAPECVTTSKASKESDVYSFGVVALEIACGRRPVDPKAGEEKMRLVDWVWELYGQGRLLEAADESLRGQFDAKQMERLMTLGLWCAHPDHKLRPSIRQAIKVLALEAPLPSLPATVPKPMYYAPPRDLLRFTYTCSVATDSGKLGSLGTSDRCSTSTQASSRASANDSLIHSRS